MGVRRSDHRSVGRGAGGSADLRSGHVGTHRGEPAHRKGRARVAQSLAVDTTFWGARVLGVAAVERELMRLRRALMAHAREQGLAAARASVLNLVVYAEREVHARRAAKSISELSLRHPSRAIVVLADRGAPADVEAHIEMHCHLPVADGATQVCYEQILVRARGDSRQRVASAVIPLLVPDLPVFLWWTGAPPVSGPPFGDLLGVADRFVVDSSDFARPDIALPSIARINSQAKGLFGVTDLNWTRLTPWREMITSFFDVPAWRPLDALASSEAGGLLFAIARSDGARVMVRVRPRFERGLEEGDVSGIRVQAEREGQLAEFVVKRQPDPRHQTTTVLMNGEKRWERTVPLPSPAIVELIGEELSILGSDRTYEESLAALVRLS